MKGSGRWARLTLATPSGGALSPAIPTTLRSRSTNRPVNGNSGRRALSRPAIDACARASTPPLSTQLDARDGGNTYRWRTGADGGMEVQLWRKAYLDSGRPYWWRRVADGAEPEVRPSLTTGPTRCRLCGAQRAAAPRTRPTPGLQCACPPLITVDCMLPAGAARRPARARGAGRAPRRAAVGAQIARASLSRRAVSGLDAAHGAPILRRFICQPCC